jgi:4-hydroxybenzoate polyprenyltransferase
MRPEIDALLIIGTLFFLIPYNLLMYGVNDVFDYESDIRNPRKGGIEGAKTPRSVHTLILWSAAILSLVFLIPLFYLSDPISRWVLFAVVFGVLAYSVPVLRFKERPILDSVTSSLHFVGPLLFALSVTGFPDTAWPLVASFFLWGMASHAFGAVQDIVPDREGGLHSIATVLGATSTVRLAFVGYALSGLLLMTYGLPTALLSLVAFMYCANIAPYLSVSDEQADTSNVAWRRFIYLNLFAGFCVTMLLIYLFVL